MIPADPIRSARAGRSRATPRSRRVRRAIRAALLAVAACLAACAPRAATQVDVTVDADDEIRAEAASLRIVVEGRGPGGGTRSVFEEHARFPITTAIVPDGGDATRTFSFGVEAIDRAGVTIVGARVTSGFVPNARAPLPVIVLVAACRGVVCPPAQTCRDGACVDEVVPPAADAGTASPDAAGAPDAGRDAPAPRIDAWQDPCADCDDGLACNGLETCSGGSCEPGVPVDCVPRGCDESADCAEPTGRCVRVALDADGDSFGDADCGGIDCDDARPDAHPLADELCNGLDDDCDARVDEAAVCPEGQSCIARAGSTACRTPVCGDGIVEGAEQCDHGGMATRPDGCGADCRFDDSCASPIDLDVVGTAAAGRISYTFSNWGAGELGAPSCAPYTRGHDRVFVVRAPAPTLRARVATYPNTAMSIHTGPGCGAELGCGNDEDGVRPVVTLSGLTIGAPLVILVEGVSSTWGNPAHVLEITYP